MTVVATTIKATQAAIDAFKVKAKNWAREVVALHNMPVPASLLQQKKALLARANTIRKMVESVLPPIEEFKNINLGYVVPVAAAAVVLAAIAAMTYWVTDFGKFKLEVQRQSEENKIVQSYIDQGFSPAQIKELISKEKTQSWFEKLIGDPQKLILPAVGLLVVGYVVTSSLRGRKNG